MYMKDNRDYAVGSLLIDGKPRYMPVSHKDVCSECGGNVGFSKASWEMIEKLPKENLRVLCEYCFMVISQEEEHIRVKRPTKEMMEEIRQAFPDFGEAELRHSFNNIQKITNKEVRLYDEEEGKREG